MVTNIFIYSIYTHIYIYEIFILKLTLPYLPVNVI